MSIFTEIINLINRCDCERLECDERYATLQQAVHKLIQLEQQEALIDQDIDNATLDAVLLLVKKVWEAKIASRKESRVQAHIKSKQKKCS